MEDQTSDNYLAKLSHEIGVLVVGCSLFDDDITTIISQSLRLNQLQENALLRPLATRAKAELLVKIGKMFLKPLQTKKLSTWSENVRKALDERNNIVHGAPCHVDDKVHFRTWSGKNRMLGQSEEWPTERITALNGRFFAFDNELNDELLPLFRCTFASSATEGGVDLANA